MVEEVYEKLAQKLDAFPSGFPRTDSGVELKILEKIFTAEEAALVLDMMPMPETADQIAERTGRDPEKTAEMLGMMMMKGQITSFPMGEEQVYIPLPFIVGIYFFQVGIVDEEFASLFEEYYKSWAEGTLHIGPTYHRVVSVERSIPVEMEVLPYERAEAILEHGKSFGLFPCMCKLQKANIGEKCDHPLNTCLIFAPVEGAYDNIPGIQSLTKEEAVQALKGFEEAGLVHTTGNMQEGTDYICSCCTCACTFLRALSEFGIDNSIAKSNFFSVVDDEACEGHGVCVDRCQFGAITIVDGKAQTNKQKCTGCGLCVIACPSKALSLERKSNEEIVHTPKDIQEFNAERAKNRGMIIERMT